MAESGCPNPCNTQAVSGDDGTGRRCRDTLPPSLVGRKSIAERRRVASLSELLPVKTVQTSSSSS